MLYYTLSQGWEFAAMAAAGAVMGSAALVFSALRHVMCVGKWGCLICDCLMGLVWAAVACFALVAACRGDARAYHFLAMAAGAALFMAAVSPAARAVAARLSRAFGALRSRLASSRLIRALFK
jgi:hypothetical protein